MRYIATGTGGDAEKRPPSVWVSQGDDGRWTASVLYFDRKRPRRFPGDTRSLGDIHHIPADSRDHALSEALLWLRQHYGDGLTLTPTG